MAISSETCNEIKVLWRAARKQIGELDQFAVKVATRGALGRSDATGMGHKTYRQRSAVASEISRRVTALRQIASLCGD